MNKSSQKSGQQNALPSAGGLCSMKELIGKYQPKEDRSKSVSDEYQDYGYRLATDLSDLPHKSLYIRLAREENRGILEAARTFVIDSTTAKSKARLFMWKLKQLKDTRKEQV